MPNQTCRLRIAIGLILAFVLILPGAARASWWNGDWSYRKEITVDAGATGANIAADAGRVPILIRLHDGNFKFTDAKEDGSDLRFVAEDDKTPLNFHIEVFDQPLGVGLVWVDVPDIKAGGTLKLWMYYGNSKASPGGDPRAAYDSGQTLVYHFGEKTGSAKDWTGYGNNALNAVPPDSGSLIGGGAKFAGTTALLLPASPSLAVASGGTWTWTAWIKPEAIGDQVLYARHDGAAGLVIGLAQGVPYISIDGGGSPVRGDAGLALGAGQWHQIAVVADEQVTLYVDAQPKLSLPAKLPALNSVASVGGDAQPASPGGTVSSGFTGTMDELTIDKVARPAGYIRALFTSEGAEGSLVHFGQDEQNSSWGGGYFVVILKSVTIDGWVIIIILLLMAAISWYVMADRARYLGDVGRSNRSFLAAYRKAGSNMFRFEQALAGGGQMTRAEFARIERAPLYRMFTVGLEEYRDRFQGVGAGRQVVSAAAVEAIRATIDATLVEETQRLNRLMVLLTIAISGGPFIGLLGTVVGVMITFAAIAAAGDVNVNAIAPGIAAAMVATCAGLFVAIPALFGYNYLLTRVKEESAKMQIFVDQFITRLAELSEQSALQHHAAAE